MIRPARANAALLPANIGAGDATLLRLSSAQFAVVPLPTGSYSFFVQVRTTVLHGLPPERTTLDVAL